MLMDIMFEEIWGQEKACSILSRNILVGKVASSYLFSGLPSTGKTKTALTFAKALLCASGDRVPCGICRSCKMFDAGSHPDFLSILRDGTLIKIEKVRELIEALSLKSYMGGRKVCIMYEADAMNLPASNAFLKTLEEPPGNTVLILVSSNPSALLPTIVSRCRPVRFIPMDPEGLARKLRERLDLNDDDALRLAILAEGCPGRALEGNLETVKSIDDKAMALIGKMHEISSGEIIEFCQSWKGDRENLPLFLERLAETFRASQTSTSISTSGTMMEVMKKLGEIPGERILDSYDLILDSASLLRLNPNVQLFLEALLLNIQSIVKRGYPIGTASN